MLNIAEIEFRQARQRLGVQSNDLGVWNDASSTFVGADGKSIERSMMMSC